MTEEIGHRDRHEALLFVNEDPRVARVSRGTLVSHARRFQASKRNSGKRSSASQEASHARSLVGWQTSGSASSDITRVPSRTDDGQTRKQQLDSNPAQIATQSNTVGFDFFALGGLRMEPFNSFPTSNTKAVMHMVDYRMLTARCEDGTNLTDTSTDIHVWSPLKAGTFDSKLGLNTYINLCWPLTLQDEMLFDATLAASRVAWCLHQSLQASDDTFMLYHRGMAMTRLRQSISISTPDQVVTELLFTIGRMLSIAYMADEPETFDHHLKAFRRLTRWYMPDGPKNDIARVIAHRLNSWEALATYRRPVQQPLERLPPTLLHSAALQERLGVLPLSLRQLALSGSLAPMMIDICADTAKLTEYAFSTQQFDPQAFQTRARGILTNIRGALASELLSPCEFQLSCGLIACCVQVWELAVPADAHEVGPPIRQLAALAPRFINMKLYHDETLAQIHGLTWCSIVFGCLMLQRDDLKGKGHIILVALMDFLENHTLHGSCEWLVVESHLRNFFYGDALAVRWKVQWEAAVQRQRLWEQQGYFRLGPKRENAVVEYLLLRDARGTLPVIENVENP